VTATRRIVLWCEREGCSHHVSVETNDVDLARDFAKTHEQWSFTKEMDFCGMHRMSRHRRRPERVR